jgi:hypothetical protein
LKAVSGNWLYAVEGSHTGAAQGRLMRIDIDPLYAGFLQEDEIQTIQFEGGIYAPNGFLDMAININSYMALTAPQVRDSIFKTSGTPTNRGNVYVIDLHKIDPKTARIPASAIVAIDAAELQNSGLLPNYVKSGKNSGQFVVSASKSDENGFVSFTVGTDENGCLDGSVSLEVNRLSYERQSTYEEKYRQSIQRVEDMVVVEYNDMQYALVADYNFIENDPAFNRESSSGWSTQIGGKIGVIQDPFGEAKYLGATTPIVGAAVEHLTLSDDGRLYADVYYYNDVLDDGSLHRSLFVWNASALIEAALTSEAVSSPIDRRASGNGEVMICAPQRYDDLGGEKLSWIYGIGTYSVPDAFQSLTPVKYNPDALSATGEFNIYESVMGISDIEMTRKKMEGTYSAWDAAKELAYDGWNFLTLGYVERQSERYNSFEELDAGYYLLSVFDGVASILAIAAGGNTVKTGIMGATAKSAGELTAEMVLGSMALSESKILTYEVTDPGKLDAKFAKQELTVLGLSAVIGAGLPLLGNTLGNRSAYKVIGNSPNTINPLVAEIVQPFSPLPIRSELMNSVASRSIVVDVTNHMGGTLLTPGGISIKLPKLAELTVEEALAAQRMEATNLVNRYLDKTASLETQAYQATVIKEAMITAYRAAMKDGNAAAQMGLTNSPKTYAQMVRELEKQGYSGEALYREIILENMKEMGTSPEIIEKIRNTLRSLQSERGGCFAAGTLVHTKDGLKPIEKIKVGDYVLSRPDNDPSAEDAYKRVTRTICHENMPVWRVSCDFGNCSSDLIVTGNHPFYVAGPLDEYDGDWNPNWVGWCRADKLQGNDDILLMNGGHASLGFAAHGLAPIFKTGIDGFGWIYNLDYRNLEYNGGGGYVINMTEEITEHYDFYEKSIPFFHPPLEEVSCCEIHPLVGASLLVPELSEQWFYRCTVYNFEVEDYHTYFVGEIGVWVHNQNCANEIFSLRMCTLAGNTAPFF